MTLYATHAAAYALSREEQSKALGDLLACNASVRTRTPTTPPLEPTAAAQRSKRRTIARQKHGSAHPKVPLLALRTRRARVSTSVSQCSTWNNTCACSAHKSTPTQCISQVGQAGRHRYRKAAQAQPTARLPRRPAGRACGGAPFGPVTCVALVRPSSPDSMKNSTCSPSARLRKPSVMMLVCGPRWLLSGPCGCRPAAAWTLYRHALPPWGAAGRADHMRGRARAHLVHKQVLATVVRGDEPVRPQAQCPAGCQTQAGQRGAESGTLRLQRAPQALRSPEALCGVEPAQPAQASVRTAARGAHAADLAAVAMQRSSRRTSANAARRAPLDCASHLAALRADDRRPECAQRLARGEGQGQAHGRAGTQPHGRSG